ncbi:MAG: ElyC/SanA/YdcF family protein, partial [Chitinispirillaceae bacterium]
MPFPTIWGWLLISIFSLAALWTVLKFSHSFLAVSKPVNGEILVVEGWVPDDALEKAAEQFRRGTYRFIAVTGGPLDQGSYLIEYGNYAQLGAATLSKLGIEDSLIVPVSAPAVSRDRTFTSAVALKNWLQKSGEEIGSLDLCSFDAHSRRSALLFRRALGKELKVGVIAIPDPSYDSSNWWRTSMGFRMVVGEGIAYVYALVFR